MCAIRVSGQDNLAHCTIEPPILHAHCRQRFYSIIAQMKVQTAVDADNLRRHGHSTDTRWLTKVPVGGILLSEIQGQVILIDQFIMQKI